MMASCHNQVVAAVHQRCAILPAKFGCVYTSDEDLIGSIAVSQASLHARLAQLQECDEWGVRVYVHRAALQEQISVMDDTIRALLEEARTSRGLGLPAAAQGGRSAGNGNRPHRT